MLTEQDIHNMYNKYIVKTPTYLNRGLNEIHQSGVIPLYNPIDRDACRVFTIMDFKEWIAKYNITSHNALFTYADDYEIPFLPHTKSTIIEYDGTPTYDLHLLDLPNKNYDFILFSQTLEHLYNPYKCVENLYNHLQPGGYIFTSVPTLNIPHLTPIHFSHFLPIGLTCMFKECGFDICEVGFWGNFSYANYILQNQRWIDIYKLPTLQNDPRNTCQTWILAQKPNECHTPT